MQSEFQWLIIAKSAACVLIQALDMFMFEVLLSLIIFMCMKADLEPIQKTTLGLLSVSDMIQHVTGQHVSIMNVSSME